MKSLRRQLLRDELFVVAAQPDRVPGLIGFTFNAAQPCARADSGGAQLIRPRVARLCPFRFVQPTNKRSTLPLRGTAHAILHHSQACPRCFAGTDFAGARAHASRRCMIRARDHCHPRLTSCTSRAPCIRSDLPTLHVGGVTCGQVRTIRVCVWRGAPGCDVQQQRVTNGTEQRPRHRPDTRRRHRRRRAPVANGRVEVSVVPNPVPFSGQPITDAASCASSKNTWFYDQVLREDRWSRSDFRTRVDRFDGSSVNN